MYYKDEDGLLTRAAKKERTIDGSKVTTWIRGIFDCNQLEVEAGTNGYMGGDAGHGSRTYLRVKDLGGTDSYCKVDGDKFYQPDEIILVLEGDSELATAKEALRWMLRVLESQTEEG